MTANLPSKIRAAELATLLDTLPAHIQVLSLDCFDTLLWRKAATPTDVFYDLQHQSHYKSLGINQRLRTHAETNARQIKLIKQGSTEVTLKEIYHYGFPALNEKQIDELMHEELAVEKTMCFAFQPTIELIKHAHARGLKIIIVSDTYLQEQQLRYLLDASMPADILGMLNKIFVSCEFGRSKSNGLFHTTLNHLQCSANQIMHIGDHPKADFTAAKQAGLNAIHLVHHSDEVNETLRMQSTAACMLDPTIRNDRALVNPVRGIIAADLAAKNAPEFTLGYATLGTIMFAFGRFICESVNILAEKNPNLKVVFLMRDAYLPSLVSEELADKALGKRVRISRFAALASSFRNKDDIDNYLANKIATQRYEDMATQLLLPKNIIEKLLQQLQHSNNPGLDFLNFIHQSQTLEIIFAESRAYFSRLRQHLQNEIQLQPGDHLVFIDLGYSGTAQIKLAPLFKQEMNIDISGLYLLSLATYDLSSPRLGLLDIQHFDDKSLIMLVTYIAILEQLCTMPEKSVIDFDKTGAPIFSDIELNSQQNNKLQVLQAECLRFVRDAKKFFAQDNTTTLNNMLRDAAATNLARLIFLPTKMEINYLQTFEFDFNLGTKEVLSVFNINKGLTGLRRRSWLHSSREPMKTMRTNYPAEWRAASIELSLALMAQHRFGLEFALNDLSHRRETMHILAVLDDALTPITLEASPTYDGYYALLVPVVNQECHLAIKFGNNYQWVELESAELIKIGALYSKCELEASLDASSYLTVDKMTDKGGGLFECLSNESLLIFTPPADLEKETHVLRIVFRPVVSRINNQAAAVA